MSYSPQFGRTTTLKAALLTADTTGGDILTSAAFDDFTQDFLVVDYNIVASREVIKCNVSSTTISSITRAQDGTSASDHGIGAAVGYMFVPSHYTNLITEVAGASTGGWQDPAETWTYSSATAITVPSGAASIYSVGDKLKYTQSIPLTSSFNFDGDLVDDKSAHNGTGIGTVTYTTGKFGGASGAIDLDGVGDAVSMTDHADFKPTGAFTIGAWVNTTASATDKMIFQSYSDNTNANGVYLNVAATTGRLIFAVGNNSAAPATSLNGTTDITGGWHYVVVSYQSNFVKVFLDGILELSGYAVTPTYAATNYVRIGCINESGANGLWFKGQIDDLFLINGFAVDEQWVAAKYALTTAQGASNITATQYNYVTAVADTSLTVTGGADYVPYNATISSPYYSKVSTPLNFPQWFNWSPATSASGSLTWTKTFSDSAFSIIGRNVFLRARIGGTAGGTGSNNVYYTLPVNYAGTYGANSLTIGSVYQATSMSGFASALSSDKGGVSKYDNSNFATTGDIIIYVGGNYQI